MSGNVFQLNGGRLQEAHQSARTDRWPRQSHTVHAGMLRHATGYALANRGMDTRALQAYMGHSNIQNTVGYTQLNVNRVHEQAIDV